MGSSFTEKIRQMEHMYAVLLEEREEFLERLKQLKHQNDSLTQTINQQAEKIQLLDKHSEPHSASNANNKIVEYKVQKEKINTLIQEIDQCLMLVGQ
jgi:seryl-tRNA synthetase